jgi:hypothetical protein
MQHVCAGPGCLALPVSAAQAHDHSVLFLLLLMLLLLLLPLQVYNFSPSGGCQEDKGWVQQLDQGWRVDAVRDAAYAALAQVGGHKQSIVSNAASSDMHRGALSLLHSLALPPFPALRFLPLPPLLAPHCIC